MENDYGGDPGDRKRLASMFRRCSRTLSKQESCLKSGASWGLPRRGMRVESGGELVDVGGSECEYKSARLQP